MLAALLLLVVSGAPVVADKDRFDPHRTAITCEAHDPVKAAARFAKSKVIASRLFTPSCIRCLARGKNGRAVEVDPSVCDAITNRLHSLDAEIKRLREETK